ncbi:MAG: DnaB-like helicase C-terminal domain-containing protein [Alphaproteobacteria bacterium]|nr:DnaB-like helicase C-terminal domain-containing protein [Alphaproteobacteria bacterium]
MNRDPFLQRLPFNQDAETQLLATILMRPQIMEEVAEVIGLRKEHFGFAVVGHLYGSCLALYRHGRPITAAALKPVCDSIPELDKLGGTAWIDELCESLISTRNGPEYARQIMDLSARREAMLVAEEIYSSVADMSDASKRLPDILASMDLQLSKLADEAGGAFSRMIGDDSAGAVGQLEALRSGAAADHLIPTGLHDLDRLLGGFLPGELWIGAGRPSMGKSALALTISDHVAAHGRPVLYVSHEMPRDQLRVRLAAARADIDAHEARTPKNLPEHDFHRLVDATRQLEGFPIHVIDRGCRTISRLRGAVAKMKRKLGVGLVVVDHIGLMHGERKQSEGSRVQEMSEISSGLKEIAIECEVPVLALAQLNRQVEQRENKKPQLSDLRDSGRIEEDADKVLLLYREAYYLEKNKPSDDTGNDELVKWREQMDACRNRATVFADKNRQGRTGTVELHFSAKTTRFGSVAPERML